MDILSFKPDFRYSTFKNYEAFSSFIHQIIYEYEKLINTKYEDEFIKLKNRFIHFINSKYRNKQMYNLLYKNITFLDNKNIRNGIILLIILSYIYYNGKKPGCLSGFDIDILNSGLSGYDDNYIISDMYIDLEYECMDIYKNKNRDENQEIIKSKLLNIDINDNSLDKKLVGLLSEILSLNIFNMKYRLEPSENNKSYEEFLSDFDGFDIFNALDCNIADINYRYKFLLDLISLYNDIFINEYNNNKKILMLKSIINRVPSYNFYYSDRKYSFFDKFDTVEKIKVLFYLTFSINVYNLYKEYDDLKRLNSEIHIPSIKDAMEYIPYPYYDDKEKTSNFITDTLLSLNNFNSKECTVDKIKQVFDLICGIIYTFNSYFTWEDAIGYMIPGRYK